MNMRLRQLEFLSVAILREPVYMRTARIGQTNRLSTLVESLAGSIVYGLTDDFHVKRRTHQDNLRIASRNKQAQHRE